MPGTGDSNPDETQVLNRSQIVTGSQKHRDPRFPPYAFTEHGAIMAATVLNSTQAVEMSIYVVRAFVQLRNWLPSNKALAQKLQQPERKVSHDQAIAEIISTIRQLMIQPVTKSRPIGFTANLDESCEPTNTDTQVLKITAANPKVAIKALHAV